MFVSSRGKSHPDIKFTKKSEETVNEIKPILSESGVLKYPCNKCGNYFTNKQGLQRHKEYVHEGLKATCVQCDKAYSSDGGLRRHISIEHKGKVFSCNMCSFEGRSPDSLKYHKSKKHWHLEIQENKFKIKNRYNFLDLLLIFLEPFVPRVKFDHLFLDPLIPLGNNF